MMKNLYRKLHNVETHLITWGDPFDCDGNDVIVCVTGNPGIPDFYEEFGSILHANTKLPICIIGQSGHEVVPDEGSNILKGQEHLFNLQAQLQHKLSLLNDLIDKKSHLHLIGHSIGAWMIIEILQMDSNLMRRVKTVNMLFPTVQKMADTWNGFIVHRILRKLHYLALFFISLLCLLPESIRISLIEIYLKLNSLSQSHVKSIMKYINPKVMEKVLLLAYDEMESVVKLNSAGIAQIKHLTYIIYGTSDNWAPVSYMESLKEFQPELQMKEVNIEHSFVLRSSEQVAEMVSQNIIK